MASENVIFAATTGPCVTERLAALLLERYFQSPRILTISVFLHSNPKWRINKEYTIYIKHSLLYSELMYYNILSVVKRGTLKYTAASCPGHLIELFRY